MILGSVAVQSKSERTVNKWCRIGAKVKKVGTTYCGRGEIRAQVGAGCRRTGEAYVSIKGLEHSPFQGLAMPCRACRFTVTPPVGDGIEVRSVQFTSSMMPSNLSPCTPRLTLPPNLPCTTPRIAFSSPRAPLHVA